MSSLSSKLALAILALSVGCGGSDKPVEGPSGGGDDDDDVTTKILGDDSEDGTRRTRVPPVGDGDGDGDSDGDADGDGVSIKGLKGRLDPYDIQRGIEPHNGALARCYTDGTKRRRYVGGKVELSFKVARDGTVKKVQLSSSNLGAWPVEKCLLDTSRKMTFARPSGGEADFKIPLAFDSPRQVSFWDSDKSDTEVKKVALSELRSCAQEASTSNPRDVWVTVYVGNRGVIKSVGFASKHKRSPTDEWSGCAEQKIKAWTLSDPQGRIAKMEFRYNP